MHPELEAQYRSIFRNKTVRELISQWAALNHLNQDSTREFLLHPNPPCRQEDISFLQHLTRRIELVKEILDEKNSACLTLKKTKTQ